MGAIVVIGFAVYFIAKVVLHGQGIYIDFVYKELPPA